MNPRDPRAARNAAKIRADLKLIADMVAPGTRVLDVGCGEGSLLDYLEHVKQVTARGLELSQEGVNACVSQGLSVVQGDADTDLVDYPSHSFDYVILSQTLQATHDPRHVLEQLVRIGRRAVVSFPNFGYWRMRLSLLLGGRMPVTDALPLSWYETPNIHLCTIRDFAALCAQLGITVEQALGLGQDGRPQAIRSLRLANLLGQHGIFLLRRD